MIHGDRAGYLPRKLELWQWTLNPHFDIRLAGNATVAGDGSRDLAHLANCGTAGLSVGVKGKARRWRGDARFRARF